MSVCVFGATLNVPEALVLLGALDSDRNARQILRDAGSSPSAVNLPVVNCNRLLDDLQSLAQGKFTLVLASLEFPNCGAASLLPRRTLLHHFHC